MSLCLLFEGTDELCGPQWSARMRALTNGAQFGFVFGGLWRWTSPRLSLGHQTRPHRIEFCIAQGLPQVRLVQRGIVTTSSDSRETRRLLLG
jgi:hypothetical protein